MLFSFSRDGALPGSKFWRRVFWGAPTNSVGLAVVLAFILGVPMLSSSVAFTAITSIGGHPQPQTLADTAS
jgi:amino acid transporter